VAGLGQPRSLSVRLISLPFDSDSRPQLALSILKEVLIRGGARCEIDYANLDYALRIGRCNYTLVAERYSSRLLGDALFSGAVFGRPVDWQYYATKANLDSGDEDAADHFAAAADSIAQQSDLWADEYVASADWTGVDLVGLSATFSVLPIVAIAQRIKKRCPHIRIVVGGALCEGGLGSGLIEAFPAIDFVCRGEGESTILALVERLAAQESTWHDMPGLCWRSESGEAIINNGRSPEVTLDDSPTPNFHDYIAARRDLLGPEEALKFSVPFETSRGCWFGAKSHCTFCGLNGEAMRHRQKSPHAAISLINDAAAYGTSTGFAVDNILPMEYYETVLPHLKDVNDKFEIFYEIKSNVTYDHCKILADAGVRAVQPGIESLSTPVLQLMRKGTSAFLNVRLLKYASHFGINLAWNILYGFPMESSDEYLEQAHLIPLISHLQPPVSGCARVRVDRFSPMYSDAARLGVRGLRPASIYSAIYPKDFEFVETLATFFDFEGEYDGWPDEYVLPLTRAVRAWREGSGQYALVGIIREGAVDIWDQRTDGPVTELSLSATESRILLACDHGASKQGIAELLADIDAATIATDIQSLCRRGLIVELDKRFLSLVVTALEEDLKDVPAAFRLPLLASTHRRGMQRLRQRQSDYQFEDKELVRIDDMAVCLQ
jgi:ribosomal peptide maturation radical SAM protein 1